MAPGMPQIGGRARVSTSPGPTPLPLGGKRHSIVCLLAPHKCTLLILEGSNCRSTTNRSGGQLDL